MRHKLEQCSSHEAGPMLSSLGLGCWQLGGGDYFECLNTLTEPLKHALGPGLDIFENTRRDRT